MKALLALKSAKNQSTLFVITALIVIAPLVSPHLVAAAELQTAGQPAEFQIKISDSSVLNLTPKSNTEQNSLSIQTLAENDPLVIQLKAFLEKYDSPMGEYAAEMIQLPQWQRALAVSYVESHMGKYCHSNNCSGIGGAPGMKSWRKYATKLDWFKDMCALMETPRYKEKYTTFRKMKGVYVQPGSESWVFGAQKKYDELMAITSASETARQELAQQHTDIITALATFPVNDN